MSSNSIQAIDLDAIVAAQAQEAHWDAISASYSITVGGIDYRSADGDLWINARTGADDAPNGDIRLIGGPRNGEVVA